MRHIPPTSPEDLAFSSLLINALPGNQLVLLPNAPTFTMAAVSDDYLATLGLQRESLLGHGVFDIFFQDGQNQAVAQQFLYSLTQVVQTKQPHTIAHLHYERPNDLTYGLAGTDWRVVNKPVLGPSGELLYLINTVVDITIERQLVETAQNNHYLQHIINLFKEPMQVLQPVFEQGQLVDFRFSLTNQAYASYANSTPDQLQGKRVSEVFPGYIDTVSFTNPVHTYQTGQPLTFEIHYNQDGLDLYNVMSTAKLDGEVVIHFTDFTRLRQLQGQLEGKINELKRSNQNLQQFAYVASHDLQEPLRKIKAFGDLLESGYGTELGEGLDHLQRLQAAASRMSTLIQDLLTYSRITTGQEVSQLVSLTDVVLSTLADLDLLIDETGAQVTVESLPTVLGDASQLGQLFLNLLSNALKFRRPTISPQVRISWQSLTASDLPASIRPTRSAGVYHRIDVTDNGIGFEEKYLDRIFQVFQRLNGKSQYAGTGIGLAISQKVTANHGGAITASSYPGQGATFSVYFPDPGCVAGQ
ncbi:ATP-binding protein (plasmid) [Fibrella sp. ES10-3-2-2]